jgi:hypothetical protein
MPMPRPDATVLPQPIFSEGSVTRDPTQFITKHPSDSVLYKEIGDLLKKDVVSFDKSRVQPDEVVSFKDALGAHGNEIVQNIKKTGKIIFHFRGRHGCF